MICLTTLLVSAFLGIFFSKYRGIAKESWKCLRDRAVKGECEADLDEKVRATVVGKALNYNPRVAKFLNNHLEKITWLLMLILAVSLIFSGIGVYNWWVHGNCNGPSSDEGCAINQSPLSELRSFSPVEAPLQTPEFQPARAKT